MIHQLHVGTDFGDASSPADAVLRLSLDSDTGALSATGSPLKIGSNNPGWLSRYIQKGDNSIVYIAMETDPGAVQAFAVEKSNGELRPLGPSQSTQGRSPCYCSLDMSEKWLFVAHYSSGSVSVLPVLSDGRLGPVTDTKQHPNDPSLFPVSLHDRQEGPHAHCILPHPIHPFVVVCDLGLSRVVVYRFDFDKGILIEVHVLQLAIGAGPRHCCWDRDNGDVLYIVNELNYTLVAASFDITTGACTLPEASSLFQPLYLLRDNDETSRAHHRGGSDIARLGRFLYVGCRATDPGLIAIVDRETWKVVGHESTRGAVPRNFKVIQSGGGKEENKFFLVVGNQESKSVVSFMMNHTAGKLTFQSRISTEPYKACHIASPDAIVV